MRTPLISCLLALLLLCGCSSAPPEYHLSGTVQYGGQLVPAGQIFFEPDYTKGNDGQAGFAYIKDGRFDTRDRGKGVLGGPHVVRIHGADGKPAAELPVGRPLFKEYKKSLDLPREHGTLNLEVPAAASK